MPTILNGRIVTPTTIIDGSLIIEQDRITEITTKPQKRPDYDFDQSLILPGFIDLHLHGLGQYEATDTDNLVGMAQLEPEYGTTAFLPTGGAMTVEQYIRLGQSAINAREKIQNTGAKILGAHLEGPFINPASSGAMAVDTRRPIDKREAEIYVNEIGNAFRMMTLSPELDGALDLIRYLRSKGIVVSLGHSIADPEQLPDFIDAGVSHVAHMLNAFRASGQKEAGVLNAGLIEHILINDALTCEFICDMQHVAPEWIVLASRVLGPDRFVAISDSLYGAGLDEGVYHLPDGIRYRIVNGVGRLAEGPEAGCLSGSVLTMDKAFVNLISRCGIHPVTAAKYTSTNAARVMGMDHETGRIEPDKKADLTVINKDNACCATFVEGKLMFLKD